MKLTTEHLPGGIAPSSMAMYTRDVAAYNDWCLGEKLDPCSAKALALWRAYLVEKTGKKYATICRMFSAVRSCVRSMAKAGVLASEIANGMMAVRNVRKRTMAGRLGCAEEDRITLTLEEIQDLVNSPDLMTSTGTRDYALLLTLATTGLRVSELVNLKHADIVRRGDGYAVQIGGKSSRRARLTPIAQPAVKVIRIWQQEQEALGVTSPYIFTAWNGRGNRPADRKMSTVAVWRLMRKYGAGIDYPGLTPHDLRRHVGIEISRQNGIVAATQQLGHRDPRSTAHYFQTERLDLFPDE